MPNENVVERAKAVKADIGVVEQPYSLLFISQKTMVKWVVKLSVARVGHARKAGNKTIHEASENGISSGDSS